MALENIRILEGKSLLWDDITTAYKSKLDSGDYILMHGLDQEVLKRLLNTKPFFSEFYVIELHLSRVSNKTLNQLVRYMKCEWMRFVVVCTSKDDYDLTSTVIRKGFNGYKISYKYWLGYVNRRLNCTPKCNLETIYKSISGRYELTDFIIELINKTNGNITVKKISTLIGKRDRLSLDILWFNILFMDAKGRKDVYKYLEEYRYGYNFIHNTLKDKYKDTIKYYDDFHNGLLNELNLREYKKEYHVSEWVLRNYIKLFNNISFEELLLIGEMIECSEINSTAKMFELVGRLYKRRDGYWKVV